MKKMPGCNGPAKFVNRAIIKVFKGNCLLHVQGMQTFKSGHALALCKEVLSSISYNSSD